MTFSYNWIKEYIKGDLPKPDRLADLVNMHAFEVKEVRALQPFDKLRVAPSKVEGRQAQSENDILLDIAVLPNRAHDCLNHFGMAREIAAICDKKLLPLKTKEVVEQKGTLPKLSLYIQASELVPRYAALVIEGVRVQDSPKWLKERLAALGVNSINNIVDLTNYIMLEMGQPLHAFDCDTIRGRRMVVRQTKGNERIETLDEQTLLLPSGTLVIEDAEGLIDLAGIKGGKRSAISSSTANIVLQAANFDAPTIYKTCNALKYNTNAAALYAHGIDPNLATEALSRAFFLLSGMGAEGKVVQIIDVYPKKRVSIPIRLNLEYAESLLGISLPASRAKTIFQSLGCSIKEQSSTIWQVKPPTRRMDLQISEDLIEEIGRMVGLEKIPATLPVVPLSYPAKNPEIAWDYAIREQLASIGFTEVYNYSFSKSSSGGNEQLVELENPISEEFAYLRSNLVENLLKNVAANQKTEKYMRLFEVGKTFRRAKNGAKETKMLGGVMLAENFYAAKGVVDLLLESLGISSVWYDSYQQTPERTQPAVWHKGKSAEIKVGDEEIGFVGEISSVISSNLKIQKTLSAFELDMEKLVRLASEEKEYRELPRFPSSVRDVAILVPQNIKVAEVMNVMESAGQALVRDIDVFDMYEGEGIPEGKKNLAFHIVYQSDERTLTGKEVDDLHNRIIKVIEQNPEWEVRK